MLDHVLQKSFWTISIVASASQRQPYRLLQNVASAVLIVIYRAAKPLLATSLAGFLRSEEQQDKLTDKTPWRGAEYPVAYLRLKREISQRRLTVPRAIDLPRTRLEHRLPGTLSF